MSQSCTVSVVIKALNEEMRVKTAIQSALDAVNEVGGEVILADSCSSDRTVELASEFPITIVQLAHPEERCCGAGPQMGYQHASGEFIYILDGDMKMQSGFLPAAVAFMRAHPDVVGVGGTLAETNTESLEYIARMAHSASHMQPGEVDRIDGGGLYRRGAIERSGYCSDRNLHSYEEFDLAVRLRVAGGRLWRLDVESVQHHGHDVPPYELLKMRWRSKYISGLGELVRAAWLKPHMALTLTGVGELRLYMGVLGWWVGLLIVTLAPLPCTPKAVIELGLLLFPFVIMAWHKRSWSKSVFAVVSWCFNAAGLIRGLLRPRRDPRLALATIVLKYTDVSDSRRTSFKQLI